MQTKRKVFKHKLMTNFVQAIINAIPVKTKGTHNGADPTAYEKGYLKVDDVHLVELAYNDCTWAVDVKAKLNGVEVFSVCMCEKEVTFNIPFDGGLVKYLRQLIKVLPNKHGDFITMYGNFSGRISASIERHYRKRRIEVPTAIATKWLTNAEFEQEEYGCPGDWI